MPLQELGSILILVSRKMAVGGDMDDAIDVIGQTLLNAGQHKIMVQQRASTYHSRYLT